MRQLCFFLFFFLHEGGVRLNAVSNVVDCDLLTYQLDDLNKNPVISRGCHEFEEERGQRQVVLGIPPGQLTDNIYCS